MPLSIVSYDPKKKKTFLDQTEYKKLRSVNNAKRKYELFFVSQYAQMLL